MGFQYISISVDIIRSHARIQRGDRGPDPPPHLKNHKNIEFLSNTGPDPLKFSKLPSQHSTLGRHRHASETPRHSKAFRWRADDGPLFVLFGSSHPYKKKKKTLSELGSRSDPNGIQERMFRQFKHLGMRSKVCKAPIVEYPTLSCKSRCTREASPCIIFSTDT